MYRSCWLMQIFELQAALEASEGFGTNFYSILDLNPRASMSDIRKAYRVKSLEWQYVDIFVALTQSGQELGSCGRAPAF